MSGKFTWLVDLSSTNFLFEEDQGAGFVTVVNGTVPQGANDFQYYFDRTGDTTTSILLYLEDQFNTNSANNTYAFQVVSSNTFGRDDFRLKLVRTSGSDDFRLSSVGDNLMLYLGAEDADDLLTDVSGEIEFTEAYNGAWMPSFDWNILDDRKYPSSIISVARTTSDDIHVLQRSKRPVRTFHLRALPGALARKDAINVESLATTGKVNYLTDSQVSFEWFWDEVISKGKKFRYWPGLDTTTLDPILTGYDECRVVSEDIIRNPIGIYQDLVDQMGEDYFDIHFEAKVITEVSPLTTYFAAVANRVSGGAPDHHYAFEEAQAALSAEDDVGALDGTYAGDINFKQTSGAPKGQRALQFNNTTTDGEISWSDDAEFDIGASDSFSVSFWFQSESTHGGAGGDTFLRKKNSTGAGYVFYLSSSGLMAATYSDGTNTSTNTHGVAGDLRNDSTWHHVVFILDRTEGKNKIWVDNVEDEQNIGTLNDCSNAEDMTFAKSHNQAGWNEFVGLADEVSIFRRALTDAEVTELYDQGPS